MDPQIQPCIFVGYPDDVKGYQLLHLIINQLIITRSVHFEEGYLIYSHDSISKARLVIIVDARYSDDNAKKNPKLIVIEEDSS
jgi:hypothetical protein